MSATDTAVPTLLPRRAVSPDLGPDHDRRAAHDGCVGVNPLARDQTTRDPHLDAVAGNPLAAAHSIADAQWKRGGGDHVSPLPEAKVSTLPTPSSPTAGLLALAAASLDDIERTRIAMGNRLRAMRDDHDLGSTPEYERAELIHEALAAAEHQAILELQRALRRHPLGPWIKATVGIGEKQGGRLLAALDDPYWNHAENRPRRGPAELWAYCGLKPGQRRQKGVKSNWNAAAKMRARLCAESCIKQAHSPYRADYDRERTKWAERDTTDLHKHNHALHVVAKAILRDLYVEAWRLRA